jgi:hypothetical protein
MSFLIKKLRSYLVALIPVSSSSFPPCNSCGGVAAVAKALEQDFVPPGAALAAAASTAQGRSAGTGEGASEGEKLIRGVLAAAADASSSSSSSSSSGAPRKTGFEDMIPMAKASATRVSAQAVSSC